ncbi:MAG: hypothetical protein ACXV3D_03725 [Halobacteriota archaeon]
MNVKGKEVNRTMLSMILSFVVSLLPNMPVTIQHDLTQMLLGHFQTIPRSRDRPHPVVCRIREGDSKRILSLFYEQSFACDLRHVKATVGALRVPQSFVDLRSTRCPNHLDHSPSNSSNTSLATLELMFDRKELQDYVDKRKLGLTEHSIDWIERASKDFWRVTSGIISKERMDAFRSFVLTKYHSTWSHAKTLNFAKAFLTYLTKLHLDARFKGFHLFLDLPKTVKVQKRVTTRIVVKDDIERVLSHIQDAEQDGRLSKDRADQYRAFTLFGAYTGQRSVSTIAKLSVGQCREAIESSPPCLLIKAPQDKIHMAHYVPLHPAVVRALTPLFDGKKDAEPLFEYNSFQMWVKRQQIPMSRFKGHFVLGDLRKFAEQHGDVIGWDQSNRAYILTHGVSGVDWSHYKHPLPEHVYDIYMRYWGDVTLK